MIIEEVRALRAVNRLREVARLRLDQEIPRPYLQHIVDEAAARLNTPIALADVLLDQAEVFIAGHGDVPPWLLDAGGTPIEWAFCRDFVVDPRPRIVCDLTIDVRSQVNPLVTVAGARAYVGVPLISRHGQVLGGLCVLDRRPRHFDEGSVAVLERLAGDLMEGIEAHCTD